MKRMWNWTVSFAKQLLFLVWPEPMKQGDLAANWPGIAVKAASTHLVNREKNTPEPGGVGATCRENWTQLLFSLTPTPRMTRPFSPFHAWAAVPSPGGSPFILNLCDEHMSPRVFPHRGSHSLQRILSGQRWSDKEFWRERELSCLKGRGTW